MFFIVPLLHSSAQHIIILEKQAVNFDCMPTPIHLVVSWNFDRVQSEVIELTDFTFSPANLNHTLTINNARINYAGEYVCQIMSSQGIINRTITLDILPGN